LLSACDIPTFSSGAVSVKGKVCLVTGGSSGVGKATAVGLAALGATVVIVSHDRRRGEQAVEDIRRRSGNLNVEAIYADLSTQASVRELAAEVQRRYRALHVLSQNAAILTWKREVTPDGNERIFAVNFLSHFTLTSLLLNLLRKSVPSRILTVSGGPAPISRGSIHFDDIGLQEGFSPLRATLQAAFAKVVFTLELARRLEGTGVSAFTFSPGLVRSNLAQSLPWFLKAPISVAELFLREACPTSVWLASSPQLDGAPGGFYVGKRRVEFRARNHDESVGKRLWEESRRMAGLR
jgi:NAD(P)-dependent dehydrogenase (short-subunit alcohol dehydrogenase family)